MTDMSALGESHTMLAEHGGLAANDSVIDRGSTTETNTVGCSSSIEASETSEIDASRCDSDCVFTTSPCELMAAIAAHLPLEDRVRLAATCKTVRAAVYDAPALWREIRFSRKNGASVTDEALYALLTRCSACTKTKKMTLMHCRNVAGWGLQPLSGSSILQEIDRHTQAEHTHGPSGLDDAVVAAILRPSVEGSAATVVKERQQDCRETQNFAQSANLCLLRGYLWSMRRLENRLLWQLHRGVPLVQQGDLRWLARLLRRCSL